MVYYVFQQQRQQKIWLKVKSSTQLHWRSFTYSRSWRTTAGQRAESTVSLCAHSDWLFTKINICSPEQFFCSMYSHTASQISLQIYLHTHKQTLCLYCPILQQQLVKKTQKVNLNTGDSTHWLATSGPAGKPENVSSDYPRATGQSEVILTRSIHKKQHCVG